MHVGRSFLTVAVAVGALALVACGDSNPASPSGTGSVTVEGVLLGEGAAFTASDTGSGGSSNGPITVEVEGTGLSVTISGNGTFKIEGIGVTSFTLLFFQDGEKIGEIRVTAEDGAKVKIVVKKQGSVIVLVDLKLDDDDDDDTNDSANQTCMIDGGRVGDKIELEGNVTDGGKAGFTMTTQGGRASGPIKVDTTGGPASFKCNGKTAGDGDCPDAVIPGAKVHVRGTLTSCSATEAVVTATEVKVQKAA